MPSIRFDLHQYYSMKAVFEETLGRASFAKLKDYGSLKEWKSESARLLKAISLSIEVTVEIADEQWKTEIQQEIQHGLSRIESAAEIDELFAGLAATLARVAFLQLGFFPLGHRMVERIPLKPSYWKLNVVRTVQYVQTEEQRARQRKILERRTRTAGHG